MVSSPRLDAPARIGEIRWRQNRLRAQIRSVGLKDSFSATDARSASLERRMKTKEIIKRARKLAKPFRVSKGKDFRLKDVDPGDTLEFTQEEDKPRAKEALAPGILAFPERTDKRYARANWAVLLI